MEKKSVVYEFSLSAPYPDENGLSMQGTSYRIESWNGLARAYDVKEAVEYILRHEKIKKVFDYNNLNIEKIIEGINTKQETVTLMIVVEDSLTVNFNVRKQQQ